MAKSCHHLFHLSLITPTTYCHSLKHSPGSTLIVGTPLAREFDLEGEKNAAWYFEFSVYTPLEGRKEKIDLIVLKDLF